MQPAETSKTMRGILLAIAAGATFGLIPVFSIPVIAAGMGRVSVLFYRFAIGSALMLAFIMYRQNSLRLKWGDVWRISILALMYTVCAITLFVSYDYISSGVATSLVYTNPIWCMVVGLLFLGERLSVRKVISILAATLGVMLLTGFFAADARFSALGIFFGLCSGIGYGVYLVLLPRLRLSKMPSLKLTFYIFLFTAFFLAIYAYIFEGGVERVEDSRMFVYLVLLGLIPTAVSNICVTMALRLIDTTIVAILGAFEPLTAIVAGVIFLGEVCGVDTVTGGLLVFLAVMVLTWKNRDAAL